MAEVRLAPVGPMLAPQVRAPAPQLPLAPIRLLILRAAIRYLVSPNPAPAVANLIALPMYFASGIFVPISQLPDFIQRIAPYLPTYRYGQLAWGAVGYPADPVTTDVL